MRIFRKSARKSKLRQVMTKLLVLGNQTKYHLHALISVVKFLHSQKLLKKIINPSLQDFHKVRISQKYPGILINKHISPLSSIVFVGKFLHRLKIFANGICAIGQFLQVCVKATNMRKCLLLTTKFFLYIFYAMAIQLAQIKRGVMLLPGENSMSGALSSAH